MNAKRKVGDIFKYSDVSVAYRLQPGYWKITSVPESDMFSTYIVVKCSATGKEFKTKSRFRVDRIDAIPEEKITVAPVFELLGQPNKANLVGHDPVKKLQRQINKLSGYIQRAENELAQLKTKLAEIETSNKDK